MFACQGIAHESAIGHAAGIGAFRTESMLLLEVLGQGHKKAMVIRGALVQVGVPVCDVEDVLRGFGLRAYFFRVRLRVSGFEFR